MKSDKRKRRRSSRVKLLMNRLGEVIHMKLENNKDNPGKKGGKKKRTKD